MTSKEENPRLIMLPLGELEINEHNPRQIEGEQMMLLINSLLVFPKMLKARPIVIAEGKVVQGGNMRTLALNSISTMGKKDRKDRLIGLREYNKMTAEQQKELRKFWDDFSQNPLVPVYDANDFTPEEVRQFIIKDNASFGSWDWDALANGWDEQELKDWGVAVWQPEEGATDREENNSAEDNYDPAEEQIPTRVHEGEIWQLGEHRLMCGDSTKSEDVQKLMQEEQADLWLTDPPYNVAITNSQGMSIKNDSMDSNSFLQFLTAAFTAANQVMRGGAAFYIWYASREHINFETAVNNAGLQVREQLIWNKNALILGRQDYQWKHEPCLYGWKEGATHYFIDLRNETTVIPDADEIDLDSMKKADMKSLLEAIYSAQLPTTVLDENKPTKDTDHPTMKPVRLFGRQIYNSSRKGDIVLDTFGGSGTTIVACEQMGRKARLMELDPKYCDVIIARWEKLTGRTATKIQ